MLRHLQLEQCFALNRDTASFFSRLPRDIIGTMNPYYDPRPLSEIGEALHYAAYARQEEVSALIIMLDKNPLLLLQTGDVQTPGGTIVRRITPYEFALGAGDQELAAKIATYFARIPNGEEEKARQLAGYRPHIDAILQQNPYDLTGLIEITKQASATDVTKLLNNDLTHESPLRNAYIQFKKDHAPSELSEPCMHYNYASLQHAFDTLECEWAQLYQTSGNNNDKIKLVWQKFIGLEMRRLPGVDRCRLAHGLNYAPLEKSYNYNKGTGEFPVTVMDDPLAGLGSHCAVDIIYGRQTEVVPTFWACCAIKTAWRTYVEQKTLSMQNLYTHVDSMLDAGLVSHGFA